nr:unnamed protein product [Callosobruchus chinensis]
MIWHEHITSIAVDAGKKLGYLFRARKYFSPSKPSHLVQRPNKALSEVLLSCLGCCCPTTMSIFDAIQKRAIRLAGDSSFTCRTQLLSHRRAVGDRSLFYRYINGVCSTKLFTMVTALTRPLRCTLGSFVPRVSTIWNSLSRDVFPESVQDSYLQTTPKFFIAVVVCWYLGSALVIL